MVRLAQDFSLRYPLVDGQGNFGSIDGDRAAAMRYTECRLLPLADELLSELSRDTVDSRDTYDGQLREPVVLPAQAPNLLINGSTGIAVGMATNIPPHNLYEVTNALLALIDDPEADLERLCELLPAPDFPGGGEILSSAEELRRVYETGQGPVIMRGQFTTETINRKKHIVVTSIPYALDKTKLIERIAQLIMGRKVPQIQDIRDESTDDVRIVMELKRGSDAAVAMAYLYKHTPLQSNFNVNLTCLVPSTEGDGEDEGERLTPARLGLKTMLRHFLDFRFEVVTRRLNFDLRRLRARIHILEGFEVVFDALDEAIALIRASDGKKDAAKRLMDRFPLDEVQTEAILELKLYRLARLEIELIRSELADKRAAAARIEALLADEDGLWGVVRSEVLEIADAHGDERRTKVVGPQAAVEVDAEAYIVKERTWVIVSRQGRVKRQRGFSDLAAIRVPEGDEVGWAIRTDTTRTVTFFSSRGRAYVQRVADIYSTTGFGEPLQTSFSFADKEQIIGVVVHDPDVLPVPLLAAPLVADDQTVLAEDTEPPSDVDPVARHHAIAVSRQGKIVRFPVSAHADVSTKNGRKFMSLGGDEDAVLGVSLTSGEENVTLATERGRVLLFAVSEVPARAGAARGVNAIKLAPKDRVLGFQLAVRKREGVRVWTHRGREVIVRETSYRPAARGGKGTIVMKQGGFERCEWPPVVLAPGMEPEDDDHEPGTPGPEEEVEAAPASEAPEDE
jgi:DNA gyrase subunit A